LLANEILGRGSEAKLFRNLREKHAFTYGVYSQIGSCRFQSGFAANAAVRNEKADNILDMKIHVSSSWVKQQILKKA
jgi:zinc protease